MPTRKESPAWGGKMKPERDVVYVVGYAKLPAETTAKHVYGVLGLGLLLDRRTGRILEVSSTLLPPYGNEFIKEFLLGKRIEEDIDTITAEIRSRYVCRTRNALLAAVDDLLKRYKEHERQSRKKTE